MHKLSTILASALLITGAGQLHADEVKMTTALTTGEKLALALNADVNVDLTWGNGAKQSLHSDGSLQSIDVKHAELTITTTSGKLTALFVQGNKLSALDVTNAPALKQLLAADNQLTTLNVAQCTKLKTLDVQGNRLTALTATALGELTDVNVAGNKLKGTNLKLSTSARPEYFVASANDGISSLPTAAALAEVKTLWVDGNALKSLAAGSSNNMRSLHASNNALTRVTLGKMPMVEDVWVDNNNLTTLDLSKGSPKLVLLAADHNKLTSILWDADCKKTCRYAYVNDNALFINSMPALKYGGQDVKVNYKPQEDFVLTTKAYKLDEQIDLSEYINRNGWDISNYAEYALTDRTGYELVKGTDYTETSKKFTFKKDFAGVVLTVKNNTGEYEFRTAGFTVGQPVGIDYVSTTDALTFGTGRGMLHISAGKPARVQAYNAAGVCVMDETLAAGQHAKALPAGIYVVNGRKVLVK